MKLKKEDREWAVAVKTRDNYTCQKCQVYFPEGRRQGLQAHHIFGRGRAPQKHMKYNITNGISLCYGHHMDAHANPLEFHEWMQDRLGAGYEDLRQLSLKLKASA